MFVTTFKVPRLSVGAVPLLITNKVSFINAVVIIPGFQFSTVEISVFDTIYLK
jgi:hypothetical protein